MLTSPEVVVSRNPWLGGTIVSKSWSFELVGISIVESVDSSALVADKGAGIGDTSWGGVVKAETTEMIAITKIANTATEIEAFIFLGFAQQKSFLELLSTSMIHFGQQSAVVYRLSVEAIDISLPIISATVPTEKIEAANEQEKMENGNSLPSLPMAINQCSSSYVIC